MKSEASLGPVLCSNFWDVSLSPIQVHCLTWLSDHVLFCIKPHWETIISAASLGTVLCSIPFGCELLAQ